MPLDSLQPIYRLYEAIFETFPLDPQSGLGGKLLYAGEIDADGRNLLYAANIAGAASLAATADLAALRAAMRDGVVDFAVNSLEEALRIVKNEIRKRQTVAVGVAAEPRRLAEQMLDRGVLPDLIRRGNGLNPEDFERFLGQGSRPVEEAARQPRLRFAAWQAERDFARWLPRLDACAKAAIPAEDHPRHRWLRLAPRYLGRWAQRRHGAGFSEEELAKFKAEAASLADRERADGNADFPVTILDEVS